jgi:hypothetical protein
LSRDEVDEELAKDNQSKEAAVKTLTTNTCIKNKIPNQFTESKYYQVQS